jgi:hypothetical protein
MNNKFDEQAKCLAQSIIRRRTLRKFGVGSASIALVCFGLAYQARAAGPTYSTIDFPGSVGTLAVDINDFGQIAGRYVDSAGVNHGFLLDHGTFASITFPGASFTRAIGINVSGDIVGSYSTPSDKGPGEHGFLLRGGVFTGIDFPNAVATLTTGINSSGDIAGFYQWMTRPGTASYSTQGPLAQSITLAPVTPRRGRLTIRGRWRGATSAPMAITTSICSATASSRHSITPALSKPRRKATATSAG